MNEKKEKYKKIANEKYENIRYCLNEKSRRIWAAAEAEGYGWGGVTIVSEATGIDHKTI